MEPRLSSLRRHLSHPGDLAPADAAPERDDYLEKSTNLGERAGTLCRLATRGARQLAMVLGVDDLKRRSDLEGNVATISSGGVSDLISLPTNGMPCAVSHSKPVNHRGRSRTTRRAKPRLRVTIRLTCGQSRPAVRLAARPWPKHHQLRQVSDPSICHQLQMAPRAGDGRDVPPATQTSSSTKWVVRHRCLRFGLLAKQKDRFDRAPGSAGQAGQILSSYKF
jgi:hypothetical protein